MVKIGPELLKLPQK